MQKYVIDIVYYQAMEIFPTCVRQSGIGFATLVSQMISIGGPYVIFLGAYDLKLPYAIMFLICLAGSIATFFLPETLGRSLPETLEEAATFGKGDKLCGYTRPEPAKTTPADPPSKKVNGFEEMSEERRSLLIDWNEVMGDVFGDVKPSADVDYTALVKDLLLKHFCTSAFYFLRKYSQLSTDCGQRLVQNRGV